MNIRFEGKNVLVTGAARGIGRAVALAFARDGANVLVNTRRQETLDAIYEEVSAAGNGRTAKYLADVGDIEQINAMCDYMIRELGGIDILVNCAGVFPQALIEDITDEDWSRVMRINLDGAFYACRAAAPYLKKSGKNGRIINLSSQAALNGTAHGVHYGASKAALLGLTYCLAKELGPDGITVNAILPGRIDTEMLAYATPERRAQWLQSTPLGRFGDTADIAELAVFLASDKGGYITGAKINVNGGLSTG